MYDDIRRVIVGTHSVDDGRIRHRVVMVVVMAAAVVVFFRLGWRGFEPCGMNKIIIG